MSAITLTKSNFKEIVESNHLVVIDFWAAWCKPCVQFSPVFNQAAEQNPDIVFGMLDSDAFPDIAAFFDIEQIPCVLAIKDQVVIDGVVGVIPQGMFFESIQQWRDVDNTEINRLFSEKALAEK